MRRIYWNFVIFFLAASMAFPALAQTRGLVNLIEVSKNGTAIILDKGTAQGVTDDSSAQFHLVVNDDEPSSQLVAEGEAVKANETTSFWRLKRILLPDLVRKGNSLQMSLRNELLVGRSPVKILHSRAILNHVSEKKEKGERPGNKVPVYNAIKYLRSERLVETKVPAWEDTKIYSSDTWADEEDKFSVEYGHDSKSKGAAIEGKNVDTEGIRDNEEDKTFKSMSEGSEQKMNGLEYGLYSLYMDQLREEDQPGLKKKSVTPNTFELKREKDRNEKPNPQAVGKIKREGDLWSSGMNDDQMRRFFVESGIDVEKKKQRYNLYHKPGHEIVLHYAMGLTANSTETDQNNNGQSHELGIGYEKHLMRTSPGLEYWTVQLDYSRGVDYYDIGGTNASSKETIFRSVLNWYLNNNPSTFNHYMWYVGAGMGFGSADISRAGLSQTYEYKIQSLPFFQLGTKYRFRAGDGKDDYTKLGLGINLNMMYDGRKLTVNERLNDNIDGILHVYDLKFSLGFSVYF